METQPVSVERVKQDAVRVIIRLGLGNYDVKGPLENVLFPESYVAWSTVVNELGREGYGMVTLLEYEELHGVPERQALAEIWEAGTLFAVAHENNGRLSLAVPLPEQDMVLPNIEI